MRKIFGAVAVVFSVMASAMAGEINGSSEFERRTGNAWVGGDILTTRLYVNAGVNMNPEPEPGNIGRWWLSLSSEGKFLENASDDEIRFQLDNSLFASNHRSVERITEVIDGDLVRIDFDPILNVYGSISANLFEQSDGKGRGEAVASFNPELLWGYNWFRASVEGGSITSGQLFITETVSPHPDWASDWQANYHLSGVIEAENFSISVIPEPTMAALMALSVPIFRRRR